MSVQAEPCPSCGAKLEWLGSHVQRAKDAAPVKVVHWVCASCGARWVQHSERGWRRTNVDLTAD